MLGLIQDPTRFLFFTGKGGVGKTSLAAAVSVSLADRGRRVLLVSTDPASNLAQVLGSEVRPEVGAVPAVVGLSAVDIDPDAAARAYRERIVGPVRGSMPEAVVGQIEEQLSGACTTEIAAFDEFTKLLTDPAIRSRFDHVVFDTAPTGHTLRLLQLPAAWSGFMDENPDGTSCLGPLSGLESQREQYAAAVRSLQDGALTTLVLVTRPERSALAEAERTSRELAALGIRNRRLVVNGVFRARDRTDALALALEREAESALSAIPAELGRLPIEAVPLRVHNVVGIPALRSFLAERSEVAGPSPVELPMIEDGTSQLGDLVDDLASVGRGLVLVMGKGGVGKTTVAAAIAAELAGRGVGVHLSTTDPAAHLAETLDGGEGDGLTVSRIDPREETRRYVAHVLDTKGRELDEAGRQLLEEDLRSPCTEEVAVFHAFSRIVNRARRGIVVLDTAPTGHTLLLLDATGAYHRDVLRTSAHADGRITTPMMRLRDPEYTRIVLVSLPETTPVLEAARLQDDLRRAGIEPYAWVINRSLTGTDTTDPVLRARAAAERPLIETVANELSNRTVLVPVQAEPPVGIERLRGLIRPRAGAAGISGT